MNPGDSQVTEDLGAKHLAETQPYNDKKLQSWDTLTTSTAQCLSAVFCFSAVTHSHHFDFACDVFKLSAVNHYTMTTPYMDTYSNMLILRNT
jgi:hypothetical protein